MCVCVLGESPSGAQPLSLRLELELEPELEAHHAADAAAHPHTSTIMSGGPDQLRVHA